MFAFNYFSICQNFNGIWLGISSFWMYLFVVFISSTVKIQRKHTYTTWYRAYWILSPKFYLYSSIELISILQRLSLDICRINDCSAVTQGYSEMCMFTASEVRLLWQYSATTTIARWRWKPVKYAFAYQMHNEGAVVGIPCKSFIQI